MEMLSFLLNSHDKYALAATKVGSLVHFWLLTVIGYLPIILQNTSTGSLAMWCLLLPPGSQKSQVISYLVLALGILLSIFMSK